MNQIAEKLSEFIREHRHHSNGINVGPLERQLSIAAGALIGLYGATRPLSIRGLAAIGAAAALVHRGLSGHCNLYAAAGVSTKPRDRREGSADPQDYYDHAIHVEHVEDLNRSPQELYRFWRNFENLPRFMSHLKSVQILDATRSRWVAKAPGGGDVEWDARIINDEPDHLIAWQSLQGADVDNSGSVRFADRGNGTTQVHVVVDYIPPAGRVGDWIARALGENPKEQIAEDMRRFKELLEAGEARAEEANRALQA